MKSSSVKLYFLDVKYSPGGQVFVVLEDLLTQFVDQLVETQVDLHNKQWSKGSEEEYTACCTRGVEEQKYHIFQGH